MCMPSSSLHRSCDSLARSDNLRVSVNFRDDGFCSFNRVYLTGKLEIVNSAIQETLEVLTDHLLIKSQNAVFYSFHKLNTTGADTENSERAGRDTCPFASYIDIFYFSVNSIKIIQSFKEKEVAAGPFGPPLNPPLHKIPISQFGTTVA